MARNARWFVSGLVLLVLVCLAVICVSWWGWGSNRLPVAAERLLGEAEQYELLSVDPRMDATAATSFHGYPVLGVAGVRDDATRSALSQSLLAGIADARGVARAACFDPRHGVRVEKSGKSLDLLICFECDRVLVYFEGKEYWLSITRSPEAALDRVLEGAGVPLAPKTH